VRPPLNYAAGVARVLVVVAALALVLPAGGTARPPTQPPFSFGRIGGNIVPFTVSINADGAVTHTGPVEPSNPNVVVSQARRLALLALARRKGFWSLPRRTLCPDSLPDVASLFVTIHSGARTHTVAVRGDCSSRFTSVYRALAAAATVRP
jgi:hypothetical protein